MDKKVFCRYDGGFWRCLSANWEEQNDGCDESMKSNFRNHCLYLCEEMRCDNVFAHEPLNDERVEK